MIKGKKLMPEQREHYKEYWESKKGCVPWNKGLTKDTDKRVRLQTERIREVAEKRIFKIFYCKKCSCKVISNGTHLNYCKKCKKEKISEYSKKYRKRPEIIERRKNQGRKYYEANKFKWETPIAKQRSRGMAKTHYYKNKEQRLEKNRLWIKNNNERRNEWDKEYRKKKRHTNKEYNTQIRLRNIVLKALKRYSKNGKIMSSKKYGIDYKAIIEHLNPFPKNLSEYHIDHIRPLCSFNFVNSDGSTNLEEVKKAFAPENHQWLTIKENLRKGGRIKSEFEIYKPAYL